MKKTLITLLLLSSLLSSCSVLAISAGKAKNTIEQTTTTTTKVSVDSTKISPFLKAY